MVYKLMRMMFFLWCFSSCLNFCVVIVLICCGVVSCLGSLVVKVVVVMSVVIKMK